jgi:NADH:ubiquinone oxidoreductase subunit F (NADH-binding)
VIEGRCTTGRNGATWMTDTVNRLETEGKGMDRQSALAQMLRRYAENMHSNEPVHTWELRGE